MTQSIPRSPGWQGKLELEFCHEPLPEKHPEPHLEPYPGPSASAGPVGGKTRCMAHHTQAPLKIQRPFYPEGPERCHSVILHTAGGMVGGDRLDIAMQVQPQAQALVTTAAASKAYRSDGEWVTQDITMTVAQGGCLEWLPQDVIVFDGAKYRQHITVELDANALWMGWDIVRLGRTVRGESFTQGYWRSHLHVRQQGRLIWVDPQRIEGGGEMMTSGHGLNHCPVLGTFALVGQTMDPETLTAARDSWTRVQQTMQPMRAAAAAAAHSPNSGQAAQIGVSRLQRGMVCRYRGHSSLEARRWFLAVWDVMRRAALQRGMCPPRVWQVDAHAPLIAS